MTTDRPVPYRVDMSGAVREQFAAIFEAARVTGRWSEVAAGVRSLHAALTWVPETVAEPVYWRPVLGQVHAGSHGPIQLRFAVNDERRYIVIAFVRLLPPDGD